MNKNWCVKAPNPQQQAVLSNSLNIHPIVAQLLINRKITSVPAAQAFLSCDLSSLHDPFLLKDMDVAIGRIRQARKKQERVLIYGDYDVDGVTSSVLMNKTLRAGGMDVIHYIPHRVHEGYGLNHSIAEFAQKNKVGLLITVDCGITDVDEVSALNQVGIDVVIFDHHEPLKHALPPAVAVVNPKRKDCPYPFKDLAAVGLVYKLAQALLGRGAQEFLDLVAVGTIADVAELNGENRVFAKEGLNRIPTTKNNGLLALIHSSGIKGKQIRPHSVGFILGPRINATGRIGSAEKALNLLLSDDLKEAHELAKKLEDMNRERQKTQNAMIEEAISMVEREINFKDDKIIVLSKEGWHRGVIGIVAARLAEKYYRPSIVISLEKGIGTGSARSVDDFHIYDALTYCSDYLENFGGHQFAAGLTIREEKIDLFQKALNEFAGRHLTPELLTPTLELDSEIALVDVNMDLVKSIETLEPYGEGNPLPLFCSRRLSVKTPPALLGRDTLKFWVTDGLVTFSAVGFGMGRYFDLVTRNSEIDLAYHLTVDTWNKEPTVQLKVKDIKVSS